MLFNPVFVYGNRASSQDPDGDEYEWDTVDNLERAVKENLEKYAEDNPGTSELPDGYWIFHAGNPIAYRDIQFIPAKVKISAVEIIFSV